MSKEYVCDSCGRVIQFPHEVKMKEFFVDHNWSDQIGFIPCHKKRRIKKHICDRCFLRLGEVTHNTKQKWIPVTERLPEKNSAVIAATDNGIVFQCLYAYDGWDLWDGNKMNITHWMPLPQSPRNEQGMI